MLTKVTAKGPTTPNLELPLTMEGRSETDVLQLRNIDGLGPVKASVNTSPYGNVAGVALTGSSVADRNIVLTVGPQPDYEDWSIQKIRNFAYRYFMPQMSVDLTFESNDMVTTKITGIVESCEPAIFSKDPEIQISIICPDPQFQAVTPISIWGHNDDVIPITYDGTADTGIVLTVMQEGGTFDYATSIEIIGIGPISFRIQTVPTLVDDDKHFQMNSNPGLKFAETVDGPIVKSVLYGIDPAIATWPILKDAGEYLFTVETDAVSESQLFNLVYAERFGGL